MVASAIAIEDTANEADFATAFAAAEAGEHDYLAPAPVASFYLADDDAVAAANIFQYRDQSVYLAKKFLYDFNFNVRRPHLINF